MPTTTLYPTASGHDAEELLDAAPGPIGTTSITYTNNSFGQPDSLGNRITFLKFPLASLGWLVNKTITNATLEFHSANTKTNTAVSDVHAEKVATPATATTALYNISTRTKTTAKIALSWPSWSSGVRESLNNSGGTSVTDLIDEVIAFAGAANIDALAFIIVRTSGTGERQFASYDSGSNMPSLVLEYSSPPFRSDERDVQVMRTDRRTVEV